MKTQKRILTALVLFSGLGLSMLSSCKPNDSSTNESELITTAHLIIKDATTQAVVDTVTFRDPDGDGAQVATTFDSIVLSPSKNYTAEVVLLDESKNPAVNITDEVSKEADEHLFVYTPNPSTLLNVMITDKDSKNLPLGITSAWSTSSAGRGALSFVLKHQPNVKNGTPSPGDTDVSIDFPLVVR